ncbi:MAG TPA: hypothetical protein VF209_00185 [Patescibacteria group bacterium]
MSEFLKPNEQNTKPTNSYSSELGNLVFANIENNHPHEVLHEEEQLLDEVILSARRGLSVIHDLLKE